MSHDILIHTALGASILMALLWLLQHRLQDATSVDLAWAAGVGLLAVLYAADAPGHLPRRILVAVLGAVWAARLAYHLLVNRILSGEGEDGRYRMLREKWGHKAPLYFFLFFQAQAFFILAFALPFYLAAHNPHPRLALWDIAGILIWLTALLGETLADRQLARFRRNPANRGKTCRQGLWRYTRHPNYFFEWLHWWAYVPLSVGSPYAWATLLAPLFMLFLLFFVTGIPYTEKRALASRGDDYRHYQKTTSAFIPWFPKNA